MTQPSPSADYSDIPAAAYKFKLRILHIRELQIRGPLQRTQRATLVPVEVADVVARSITSYPYVKTPSDVTVKLIIVDPPLANPDTFPAKSPEVKMFYVQTITDILGKIVPVVTEVDEFVADELVGKIKLADFDWCGAV